MGCRKIVGFFLSILFITSLSAEQTYEEYLKEQNSEFTKYVKDLETEYKEYKDAYEKAFESYSKNILEKWPTLDTTTKYQWVEYDKDYLTKKRVDFEKEEITLEVIAKDEEEAKKRFEELSNNLVKDNIESAYKNDQLEQKINKIIKKENAPKNTDKIVGDLVSRDYIMQKLKEISTKPLMKAKHNNKFIYKLNVKLPPDSMIKKAKVYKDSVIKNSDKNDIPAELVYAIMHSESSFNPMARSHVPAFGLMQIVPKTAGVDTYKFLYGKEKLLSSDYLYNADNNIKIGSAYLHIIYFRYMKKIKDPISRIYCTIAAYNTGAGNVAKSFIGTYNIYKASSKINSMSHEEVYKHLLSNLPYNETRKYLVKVGDRVSVYKKLIGTKL